MPTVLDVFRRRRAQALPDVDLRESVVEPVMVQPLLRPHVPSHAGLLTVVHAASSGTVQRPGGERVDLVVIPTSRPDPAQRHGVLTAVELAEQRMIRQLLIVCSKDAAKPEALAELGRLLDRRLPTGVTAAVTVLDSVPKIIPSFAVDRLPLSSAYRRFARDGRWPYDNDVAAKRNLGLFLAHRLGRRHVLFLDDDVRPVPSAAADDESPATSCDATLNPGTLSGALSALRPPPTTGKRRVTEPRGLSAVGWTLRGYDDNSVVCRVRQLLGHQQDQFIGGGALLVGAPGGLPFCPAIYNEDWLFLLAMIDGDRTPQSTLACGGVVLQDAYDGYLPRRARSEELGDILGEGLMSLVHEGLNAVSDAQGHAYWREILASRRAMIDGLRRELDQRPPDPDDDRARAALDAALQVHTDLDARKSFWTDQFVRYGAAWQTDLELWRTRLTLGAYGDNADLLPPSNTFLVGAGAAPAFGLGAVPFGLLGPFGPASRDDVETPSSGLSLPV